MLYLPKQIVNADEQKVQRLLAIRRFGEGNAGSSAYSKTLSMEPNDAAETLSDGDPTGIGRWFFNL